MRTYLGKPILAVGVAYYDANDRPTDTPRKVQWIEEAERQLSGRRILLVDEVDDSRTTLEYCIRELMRHNPAGISVAVLHNKLKEKRGVHTSGSRASTSRAATFPISGSSIPGTRTISTEHDALAASTAGPGMSVTMHGRSTGPHDGGT